MTLQHVDILFQVIVFLFAISIHESAHAWMANRRGDPTAYMLGRVTLNPLEHIGPGGTMLLPAIAIFALLPVLGWAKPTPVNPRNFRRPVADDILTSVAGPVSNFLVAFAAVAALITISVSSSTGHEIVQEVPRGILFAGGNSILVPITMFLFELLVINVVLAVFNLIPVPPLDGSHVLRHLLPVSTQRIYDTVGWIGLLALIYLGGGILGRLIFPFINAFNSVLVRL